MKARGNVIIVKPYKSCNLVFVRPKSDIHGYVFSTHENLSTIFWTKFWTQFIMLEIIWLVQKTNQIAKKFGPMFCQKTDQRFWHDVFLTKLGPNFFVTWFVFWTSQMISSMKNWVQNFVQKMVDKFSWVKKTYPWMSDFGLTKTKLQLLSCFTTITLPLAFISICYLPYYSDLDFVANKGHGTALNVWAYNLLERALRALASSSGGAACSGATRGQPQGSIPGVRGSFQGDLSEKKSFVMDGRMDRQTCWSK